MLGAWGKGGTLSFWEFSLGGRGWAQLLALYVSFFLHRRIGALLLRKEVFSLLLLPEPGPELLLLLLGESLLVRTATELGPY